MANKEFQTNKPTTIINHVMNVYGVLLHHSSWAERADR